MIFRSTSGSIRQSIHMPLDVGFGCWSSQKHIGTSKLSTLPQHILNTGKNFIMFIRSCLTPVQIVFSKHVYDMNNHVHSKERKLYAYEERQNIHHGFNGTSNGEVRALSDWYLFGGEGGLLYACLPKVSPLESVFCTTCLHAAKDMIYKARIRPLKGSDKALRPLQAP